MFNFKQKSNENTNKANENEKETVLQTSIYTEKDIEKDEAYNDAINSLLSQENTTKDINNTEDSTEEQIEISEFKNKEQEKQKAIDNNDFGIGILSDSNFGPMLEYIKDDNVTDINWNGHQLWIDDLEKGRYVAPVHLTEAFVNQFATQVSNVVSESFNKYNPRLEAETDELRISILHKIIAHTGTSISIRKTPAVKRIKFHEKIQNGTYCSEEMANFLSNSVKAKMNIIICGLPGDGKTELLKYLTNYIPPKDRVITIEDNLEIHYHSINPGKDCIEMKVNDSFTYVDAIKTSLRQLPKWIMLSEARSTEVKYLIEAMSAGPHCITTIHTDDTRKIPARIKNMAGEAGETLENDIYTFVNVAILIRKKIDSDGNISRYISQIAVFNDNPDEVILIFDEGKRTTNQVPEQIMKKFKDAKIDNPFEYVKLQW